MRVSVLVIRSPPLWRVFCLSRAQPSLRKFLSFLWGFAEARQFFGVRSKEIVERLLKKRLPAEAGDGVQEAHFLGIFECKIGADHCGGGSILRSLRARCHYRIVRL